MDKTKLTVGVFVVLAIIGTTWYVAQEDQANLYQCEDIVGLCFKLSKTNDGGLQTRCYYNESSPRKYKNCGSGWVKVELTEIQGEEITLPDYEKYQIKHDFTSKQEAEDYITNLKQGITYDWMITTIEQRPYSDELEVRGIVSIIKEGDILADLLILETVDETLSKEEIMTMMGDLARESFENWKPDIIISRLDKI